MEQHGSVQKSGAWDEFASAPASGSNYLIAANNVSTTATLHPTFLQSPASRLLPSPYDRDRPRQTPGAMSALDGFRDRE
jgi:hypothetical protein